MKLNIKKWFKTTPSQIEDSRVEISVEIEEKTKAELFDDAVQKVVEDKIAIAVRGQLIEACYTEEEIKHTNLAIELMNTKGVTEEEVLKAYPKAAHHYGRYALSSLIIGMDFDLSRFVSRLVKDSLETEGEA